MSRMTDEVLPWMLSFQSSKKWMDSIQSEETKRVYILRFKQYCDAVNKNPDELIALKIEGLRNITTDKEFQAEDLLDNYLYNGGLTESMAVGVKTAVKSFYATNRRSLEPSVGKNISAPEPKQRTPKLDDLVTLEENMLSIRDRALVWLIASGAFRDFELTLLVWGDIKDTKQLFEDDKSLSQQEIEQITKEVPYYLVIEGSRLKGKGKGRYKKLKHVAFIHWYAGERLDKYKSWLERFLKDRNETLTPETPLLLSTRSEGIEKLGSVNPIFVEASLRAWEDLEKKRFSPQDVRDFLQSALESAGIHSNMIAPMLSHKVRGVEFHYSSHEITELLGKFRTALPWLVPKTVERIEAETKKKLKEEEEKLTNLQYDNINLKKNVNTLSSQQEHDSKELQDLKNLVNKIYFLNRASGKPERVKKIRELEDEWRTEDETELEEQDQKKRDEALGQLSDTLSTEKKAEVERRTEEYRKQQEEKPEE
jgi:hypothetical protein